MIVRYPFGNTGEPSMLNRFVPVLCAMGLCAATSVFGQTTTGASGSAGVPPAQTPPIPAAVTPPNFIIGPDDILTVVFWREKDLSADVVVRPDGKISLPL